MRNGSFPEAPAGGHNSHVGTLLDAVPVAPPGDPAEPVEEAVLEALDEVLAVPPPPGADPDPVAALPEVDPVAVVPVALEEVDWGGVAAIAFAPMAAGVEAVGLLPSVTTPWLVTL